jgi:MFS family permease
MDNQKPAPEELGRVRPIGHRNVITILLLGTTGQIAWLLENNWFNVFVDKVITNDPAPIAWMVGVSAVVATLTTLFMGIVSDRTTKRKFGNRKPFIVFGYIAWGIITAVFPLVSWIQHVGAAVIMVVIVDAVMTFFGSTANDAALNAWMTDIGHSSNRNRIQSINSITALIATVVGLGLAVLIWDALGQWHDRSRANTVARRTLHRRETRGFGVARIQGSLRLPFASGEPHLVPAVREHGHLRYSATSIRTVRFKPGQIWTFAQDTPIKSPGGSSGLRGPERGPSPSACSLGDVATRRCSAGRRKSRSRAKGPRAASAWCPCPGARHVVPRG